MQWNVLYYLVLTLHYIHCNEYRLPTSLSPQRYDVKIITHLDEPQNPFRFTGEVDILLKCEEATDKVILHSKELNIFEDKSSLTDLQTNESIKITNHSALPNDLYILDLESQLKKGSKYAVQMKFEGALKDGLAGYYRSSYLDPKTNQKRWLATTQFEATDARRAFPCFDEPSLKAVFKITLGRHKNFTSLSNMPLNRTLRMEGETDWFWDEFEDTVPMSTYLVAFVVSDFKYKTSDMQKDGNQVTFRTWAREDAIQQVEFAKEVGPRALAYFEDFFNIPYPLPKVDMIAIPDFAAGAMENWGLVTYREVYLLYDPAVSSLKSKHRIASVISHELAHQWFGNLVTMKWWTDLWLNEGFATFMAATAVENMFPQWKSLSEEVVENLLSVYALDSLKSSHPISVPIGNPSEISQIFDTISYKKGSYLIRMMSFFLQTETLRKGVSNYLKERAYSNAEQDDLWHYLTLQAHQDEVLPHNLTVKEIMDTWTLQTGYPVVNIKRDCDKKKGYISQERYLTDVSEKEKLNETCWWVPLSFTTEQEKHFNNTKPKTWLSCEDKQVEIDVDCEGWIIANIQASGLYRVNYDEINWEMIINTLINEPTDIPVINRVLLIENSMELAKTGYMSYETAFKLLTYMKNENEYLPWKTALAKLKYISKMMKRTAVYGEFKKYVGNLIEPVYQKLGGLKDNKKKSNIEELDTVNFKSLIASAACQYKVSNCNKESIKLFQKWQKNVNSNPIPQDLRSVVYCAAVENGGEKEWNFLWEQYKKSNVGTEKGIILYALGCTKELWILNRYLEWSIDDKSGIRKQDAVTVFSAVSANEVGYFIAKSFFENKLKAIHKSILPKENRITSYTSSIASNILTDYEQKEFMNLVADNREYFNKAKLGIQQDLETTNINVLWQRKYRQTLENILLHVK